MSFSSALVTFSDNVLPTGVTRTSQVRDSKLQFDSDFVLCCLHLFAHILVKPGETLQFLRLTCLFERDAIPSGYVPNGGD